MNTTSLNWTSRLLGASEPPKLGDNLARSLWATGLSSLFGLAMGAREGGLSLLTHAAGVPIGIFAVLFLGLPALFIVLSLCAAPISMGGLGDAAAKAFAQGSLVLAGLAPATALFVVTSETSSVASVVSFSALAIGGAVAVHSFISGLVHQLNDADPVTRYAAIAVTLLFSMFSVALATRVWGSTLTLFGGA